MAVYMSHWHQNVPRSSTGGLGNPQPMTNLSRFQDAAAADDFKRPSVCSPNEGGDRAGVYDEIDPGLVDHVEFYLLNYFKPGRYKITRQAKNGLALVERIGCTSCHLDYLTINSDRWLADVKRSTIRGVGSLIGRLQLQPPSLLRLMIVRNSRNCCL
jgi:hypothetical protein